MILCNINGTLILLADTVYPIRLRNFTLKYNVLAFDKERTEFANVSIPCLCWDSLREQENLPSIRFDEKCVNEFLE